MNLEKQKQLADNLRQLRKLFGYTQAVVSEKLNMCRSSYALLESGKRLPDPYRLCDLADLYHVSADMLFRSDCCEVMEAVLNSGHPEGAFELSDAFREFGPFLQGRLAERALVLLEEQLAEERAQKMK